jgi:D-psicose/D-tagatose/L-ribulose 3-epimerase
MKIAASNIAWPAMADDAAFAALSASGVEGLEVAPTRVWPNWEGMSGASVARFRAHVESAGLRVSSLQSILFQKPHLQLFGPLPLRNELFGHLCRCADLAAGLGARCLVFGAPKNRLRGDLCEEDAFAAALEFFARLGEQYASRGVCLAFEANPKEYGCDFATGSATAARLVRKVGSPGFRLHLDAACLRLAHEDPAEAIREGLDVLCHFHASEPYLAEFEHPEGHEAASRELETGGYDGWVALEMRAAQPPLPALMRAAGYVRGTYGGS